MMHSEIIPPSVERAESVLPIEKDLDTPIGKSLSNIEGINHELKTSQNEVLSQSELDRPLCGYDCDERAGLSDVEKSNLKEQTGWSDSIIDSIKSKEEAVVYVNANLKEVDGNLERTDIDWSATIPQDKIDRMRSLYGDEVADKWSGMTNLDLIKAGKAPYGPDGERINLHHIGQKVDSPLAELTNTEHKQYDGVLHDKTKTSEIERPVFRAERQQYWMSQYESLQN